MTATFYTGLRNDDYWDIAKKLQASVELWEKCTEISGGCLVPAKSWWALVYFTWKNEKWEYTKDMDDVSVSIKYLDGLYLTHGEPKLLHRTDMIVVVMNI